MAEKGADVVELFPKGSEEYPAREKPKEGGYCSHMQAEYDLEARRLYCRDCGREISAFDFLVKLSEHFERHKRNRDGFERDARLAQGRLEELQRQEKNAKARVRRARRGLTEDEQILVEALAPLAEVGPRDEGARDAWHSIPAQAILGIWQLAREIHGRDAA